MKYIFILLFIGQSLYSQSYFDSEDKVIKHLLGEWKLDYSSWMGNSTDLRDSSLIIQFMNSSIDSLPLTCKTFKNDSLIEQSNIEIEFETKDGFPGPWRLKGLPYFLPFYMAILEDITGEYMLSEEKMILFQMSFDGVNLSLSKIKTNSSTSYQEIKKLMIYPNPVENNRIWLEGSDISNRELSLFNVSGQQILKTRLKANKSMVKLPNLESGIYLIRINDKNRNGLINKIIVIN